MRVTGALFTYQEMQDAIDDETFDAGDTPILTLSNKTVTVQNAEDMLLIYPLNGPTYRCPSWDELIPKPVIPPVTLTAVLTVTGDTLTATVYGGTGPYNYHFTCIPVGRCYEFHFGDMDQPGMGNSASTTFGYTSYYGTSYTFAFYVTDDLGHSAGS